MLRGESMADVIFNGSNARKPVGTASIELVFDNAEGRAGGQYAQYAQISVKRQVTRDGQSQYWLNGGRCRRKDITDLFLGTGLGPRSYAIIEQGMISRIIESKPEELRVYLEEAAGISKYKERRRETENRIRGTRENLDRLNDLRDELGKRLRTLERQAAAAEKYKAVKAEERRVTAELLLLRLEAMEHEVTEWDRRIGEQETRLEAAIAAQRHSEAQIQQQREAHVVANDGFNEVQGRYYALGAEIARLEEAIQFARESRRRQEQELERVRAAIAEAAQHREQDEARLTDLASTLERDAPALEAARAETAQAQQRQAEFDQGMQSWQQEWDDFNQRAAEPSETAQLQRARITHLEEQETQLQRRGTRLQEERERLAQTAVQAEVNELLRRDQDLSGQAQTAKGRLEQAVATIGRLRGALGERQRALAELRSALESDRGRLSSLLALQQAAKGSDDKQRMSWLRDQGLEQARQVLQGIEVTPRWQSAVEVVLGGHLQGVLVEDLGAVLEGLDGFSGGQLSLVEASRKDLSAPSGSLAEQVTGPDAVRALLAGVLCVESVEQALARSSTLEPGQSLVTPEGIWLGRGWVWRPGAGADRGALAREREIRELGQTLESRQSQARTAADELERDQRELAAAEQEREERQRHLDRLNRELSDVRAQLEARRARVEHLQQRQQAIERELQEISVQQRDGTEQMAEARRSLHQALAQMEDFAGQRQGFLARRERLRQELEQAREQTRRARETEHQVALRVEAARSSESSLRAGIERSSGQLRQLQERERELAETLEQAQQPLAQQQQDLEGNLGQRAAVEQELKAARQQLSELDNSLRELEQQRQLQEHRVQQEREKLDGLRMKRQELRVRAGTMDEQLRQAQWSRAQLRTELAAEANVEAWQQRAEELAGSIQRLGPINLAAIDEFREQSERMEYLGRQHQDITDSLATLEDAIAKIDRETRTRFKETFERVNTGLQATFPKLFGGGHAYLELTGEELLDAGVAIMARPPGKRNASIHLLSGGEKALSAVALVFSIFQLNPAPFCMLDEVDAPLDEANVGRFSQMVRDMSDQVQFIFVTHNKVTMEIADYLVGVTMNEPGVSRLVSVDLEEAARMAAV
jgi:chromosome segregation protein